ncbi:uncharacterized protein JCM15063_003824 [Sporobolomyces koalae]|uniref:uncharacterized protein n=1 Tax=Sporobolomyces koalae TaxID=500713 RepID=UPI00317CB26C
MPPDIKDSIQVGPKCVVVDSCDLRGDITIGPGTVLQPRCTLLALSGPIILGSNNIVEENVVIVNRLKRPLVIGDHNLFQVGARIESPTVGDHNSFGIRSRTSPHVTIGSHCSIGAGCIVLPNPFAATTTTSAATEDETDATVDKVADYTHVFGADNRQTIYDSGEGSVQERALFAKHLDYLRETLPKFHKLKMF